MPYRRVIAAQLYYYMVFNLCGTFNTNTAGDDKKGDHFFVHEWYKF
jgi:hypothetical protein